MHIYKYKLEDLKEIIGRQLDIFICCGSYEERCKSVAENIDPSTVGYALIAENKNLSNIVGENSSYLRQRFDGNSVDIAIDTTDPLRTADNLMEAISRIVTDRPLSYLVDVTTFTHESLLILFKLLRLYVKKTDSVKCVYTSAADYSLGSAPGEEWLSKGVSDIRSVLGYPGEVVPSRKTHLLVLVGYERERAVKLIEGFEPNIISLGYGRARSEEAHGAISASRRYYQKLAEEISSFYTTVNRFEFPCNDPWESKKAILSQSNKFADCNIVIAPMSTKISTIGCALASFSNDGIQLCYAQALQYNYRGYSSPGNECYVFEVPELMNQSMK